MKTYLLPQGGKFYKANLHMHTKVSDGQMTPEEVKEAYMEKGYSIVAFTDHEALVPHTELTDENFVAITSYEIATNEYNAHGGWLFTRTYHINLYAKDPNKDISPVFTMSRLWPAHAGNYMSDEAKAVEWPREYGVDSINALIARAREDGFIVSLNHPNWSLQGYEDYAALKGIWGVEYYNTGCVRAGYPDTMQPIDDLLRLGQRVFPLATDDAHASRQNPHDCFGGFCMVKAEKLDYATVFEALEKGDFYASSAPLIEELPMTLECKLVSFDKETELLIGEIVNVSADERILGENGKIDPSKLQAISYDPVNRHYYVMGEKVGNAFKDGTKLK